MKNFNYIFIDESGDPGSPYKLSRDGNKILTGASLFYILLGLYKELLNIINELEIRIYYRLIDKTKYRGVFAVDGKKKLHNVFDDYNLAKLVYFAVKGCCFTNAEAVIDRTDRRLLDGKFDFQTW